MSGQARVVLRSTSGAVDDQLFGSREDAWAAVSEAKQSGWFTLRNPERETVGSVNMDFVERVFVKEATG